ncbi:MAG: GmrSD restriction endonuclease domain-containing protein, partial [Streptosporangiaceae bacterium]
MGKAEASVEELVRKIERGELGLPEMQRQYVWRAPRVRDLFDSLYRGYPSGAILLWETDEEVPLQDFAVSQQAGPYQRRQLLLDGQQRLTSLSALIRGEPVTVRCRKKPIDLLFNLDHPEGLGVVTEVNEDADSDDVVGDDATDNDEARDTDEADSTQDDLQRRFDRMTFVVATKKLEQLPTWIRVSEVFKTDEDAPFLARAGVEKISDPRYTKYSQRLARLRAIRSYMYRMDVLEPTLSYDEVTEIFVRVNSLGAKLRSSDLALAQITAKWRNSLALFQGFQERCAVAGFDLDLGIYLKAMIAFATGQSRFLTVGSLSMERLQEAWTASCEGIEFAINFLKRNAGIESPALLSSPFMLVTIAYFGHIHNYALTPEVSGRLCRWALLANAKGRYSRGSSETLLDQDLGAIRASGDPVALLDRLRSQVGRLEVVPDDLAGRNQRSAR